MTCRAAGQHLYETMEEAVAREVLEKRDPG